MKDASNLCQLYCELAEGYAERGQPQFRDRFLVLAADAAQKEGDSTGAEHYRQRLLAVNPHHLLKPYPSFARAMNSPDVQTYVHDLRRNYPPDIARGLLLSMRDVKEQDASRQIPVTAPVINFENVPDLLMDDVSVPLQILSFHNEPAAGIPPTLPPEKFPAAPPTRLDRPLPQSLYDVAPPPARPPLPRSSSRPRPTIPLPAPLPEAAQESSARRKKFPQPVPLAAPSPTREPEAETTGAWLSMLLFVLVAGAGLALAVYTLALPWFNQR